MSTTHDTGDGQKTLFIENHHQPDASPALLVGTAEDGAAPESPQAVRDVNEAGAVEPEPEQQEPEPDGARGIKLQ